MLIAVASLCLLYNEVYGGSLGSTGVIFIQHGQTSLEGSPAILVEIINPALELSYHPVNPSLLSARVRYPTCSLPFAVLIFVSLPFYSCSWGGHLEAKFQSNSIRPVKGLSYIQKPLYWSALPRLTLLSSCRYAISQSVLGRYTAVHRLNVSCD